MTPELAAYYDLDLWHQYLEAKRRTDHAHGEWIESDISAPHEPLSRVTWRMLEDERRRILAELRATPEHKAAFGW